MAGVTDSPFRRIARRFGAGLLYSECISAEGLRRSGKGSFDLCRFDESERPFAIQLFGATVEAIQEAASIVADQFAPNMIDINCGCPVKKFVTRGCGGALMQTPDLIGRMVEAARAASGLPVSVKLRSGYAPGVETAPMAAACAREAGVSLVAIHGRFVRRAKGTAADWSVIRRVKEAIPDLPVVGNGDVFSYEDAAKMRQETGCDRVMIARWAEGRPWVFEPLRNGAIPTDIANHLTIPAKISLILEQLELMVDYYGEKTAVFRMRKQLGWYSHGWPEGGALRRDLMRIDTAGGVEMRLEDYQNGIDPEYLMRWKPGEAGDRVIFVEET